VFFRPLIRTSHTDGSVCGCTTFGPNPNKDAICRRTGLLASHFCAIMYRIRNVCELLARNETLKLPSASVNPDSHASNRVGSTCRVISGTVGSTIVPVLSSVLTATRNLEKIAARVGRTILPLKICAIISRPTLSWTTYRYVLLPLCCKVINPNPSVD